MGDLIGKPVSSKLSFISYNQIKSLLKSNLDICIKNKLLATISRINILYMIAKAGSGHIGSSFSSIDLITYIYLEKNNFIFFSSKGHDAPALYSTLLALGKLPFNLIHKFRKINGLPGHPDIRIKNIVTNTGSLGMGISKAKGIAHANRINKIKKDIYVLLGDGELQEGQIWESLHSLINNNLNEIKIIIDHNKIQSDSFVTKTSDLGNLKKKLQSFGFKVIECNGNSYNEIREAFNTMQEFKVPTILIAHTIKGKGVSFMENKSLDSDNVLYRFHSGAPSDQEYELALTDLLGKLYKIVKKYNISINISNTKKNIIPVHKKTNNLVDEYSKLICKFAKQNKKILCLDADLIKDTGLIEFKKRFPKRFFECGIAEQDMVSMAGGLALNGFIPIVHSFSAFLSSRANEQIYNNSTELKKIIYMGFLAGVLPSAPGHSHQSIRDIASLSSIPNLIIAEPSNQYDLNEIIKLALSKKNKNTFYLRICSMPIYSKKIYKNIKLKIGEGSILKKGGKLHVISYGPTIIDSLIDLVDEIKEYATVVNFPWLNIISESWVKNTFKNIDKILIIENHYEKGGLADFLVKKICEINLTIKISHKYVKVKIPPSGQPNECLELLGLDRVSLKKLIIKTNNE